MSAAHTPGPWNVGKKYATDIYPSSANRLVARVMTGGISDDESRANARLIAAAPELLTWLKWSTKYLSDEAKQSGQYTMLLAAIAKATGGAA